MRKPLLSLPRLRFLLAALCLCMAGPAHAQHPQGQRPGACCITTASGSLVCVTVTPTDCATLGGQFAGANVPCTAGNPCPNAPTGACCLALPGQGNGRPGGGGGPATRCVILNEVQCANQGGTFMGNGTACTPPPCPAPPPATGACCMAQGACAVMTPQACRQQSGTYRGHNTTCSSAPCPGAPRGACCVQHSGGQNGNTNCIFTDAVTCALLGGTYAGDNVHCRNANCPPLAPRTGACCIGSVCSILTPQDCRSQGGAFHGFQSVCATTVCPGAPTGACCLAAPGGQSVSCIITSQAACTIRGGIYQGDSTTCRTVTCISPTVGACCVRSASGTFNCIEVSPAVCTILGGTFGGLGVPCSAVPCPPPCPCDINGDGVVDAADEAAFQLLFAAGNADVDMDGDTDLDDWTAFYACYPQGCP